jgi:hypothetical protein
LSLVFRRSSVSSSRLLLFALLLSLLVLPSPPEQQRMKFSAALLISAAASASAAGTCTYVDSFGADLCEVGNNDSWLPDWVEDQSDKVACQGMSSSIGCQWDNDAAKCSQNTVCGDIDEDACNSLAAQSFFWKEADRCDPHDAMSCTADGTGFHKCTHKAWDNLVEAILNTVSPWDPSTWNISSLIEDFATRMKNGCVGEYTKCFFLTECGNPELLVTNICEEAVAKICDELNTAADECPLEWCKMGVTQGSSLIDIALGFADDFDLATFFDAAKINELKETIEMIAGGSISMDWIDFDTATGKVSITIPDNTVISQAEFDDLVKMLENMLSGSSSSAMTSGFAVKSVNVAAPAAITIDSSKGAWSGKKAESEGMSMGAILGIAVGCVGLVGAVVGGVVYTKGRGGVKAPKKHGGNMQMAKKVNVLGKGANMKSFV